MPAPLDLVLHIGTGKTGTTTVQSVLGRSRDVLAANGTLYPRSLGRTRHQNFAFLVMPDAELVPSPEWFRAGNAERDPKEFRRRIRRRFARELTPDVRRVVISDEALYRRSARTVARTRRFAQRVAPGGSTRVVAYLRRQDDHLASNYQQVVKGGVVDRLADWARTDLSPTYDYHRNLTRWRDHLEPDGLVVRVFETDRFVGGSLIDDFLDAAGLDLTSADLAPAERANESLSAEAVEVLRLLNLHRVEHQDAEAGRIINQEHVLRLRQVPGPTLSLPDRDLDLFLSRWRESNAAVARSFCGLRGGELFDATRRRSDGTTTEQVLDPRRLDYFFELLDVPEEHHAAIRRIAEREARQGQTDGNP